MTVELTFHICKTIKSEHAGNRNSYGPIRRGMLMTPIHARSSRANVLLLAAAVAQGTATQVQAAETATVDASEAVEAVVVTGSRIRGAELVGSSRIDFNVDDLIQSGASTPLQALQQLPQVSALGISEGSRGQAGGNSNITYGSAINIRGLGPYATLTLINGRRVVPQGFSGTSVEPGIIPSLAIERVEIVADGASAIYGSDAITGVANFVLRKDFEGFEAIGRYGVADDYDDRQVGFLVGHRWTDGGFMLAFEHNAHSDLKGVDRDFFQADQRARGGGDYRERLCSPGNIVVGGVSYAIPSGGVTPGTVDALVPDTVNRCFGLRDIDLLPKQESNSAVAHVHQEIGGVRVFADALASKREFYQSFALSTGSITVPSSNAFFVSPVPAAQVVVQHAFADLPTSDQFGYSKALQGTIGVEFDLGESWIVSSSVAYGNDKESGKRIHDLNNAALTAALASSDPAQAYNPFGGTNSPAVLANLANVLFHGTSEVDFLAFDVGANGTLLSLPAGDVQLAVGYEGQRLDSDFRTYSGVITSPSLARTVLSRDVDSFYVEGQIPLFSERNARPGLHKLAISAAVRYDDYDDVGETTNPKFGLDWAPVPGWTFKATYGTSFRAPLLNQLAGNSSRVTVQNYSDPTRGGEITQGLAVAGPNFDLEPEEATTWTVGLDIEPQSLPQLRASISYFDIEYEGQINSVLGDFSILNREGDYAGTGVITRNPDPALVADLLSSRVVVGVVPDPVTLLIDARNFNLGRTLANGFDFSVSYRTEPASWGRLGLMLAGSYLTKYDTGPAPRSEPEDRLNTIFTPLRLRMRATLGWSNDSTSAALTAVHYGSYDNNLTQPVTKVSDETIFNLNVQHSLGGVLSGTTLEFNVLNLFDTEPPYVDIAPNRLGGGGFDPTLISPVGRMVSLGIRKRW